MEELNGVRTGPLAAGERVTMTDPKGRRHSVLLAAGGTFHTTRGGISHGSGAAHGDPRPTLASVIANRACSAATTRSTCWASRNPPA